MVLVIPGAEAYHNLARGFRDHTFRLPTKNETDQFRDGGIFPPLKPRFFLRPGETVFTIGSCFARSIEYVLSAHGFDVPVSKYQLPPGETNYVSFTDDEQPSIYPTPFILNEYSPATIAQRIESIVGEFSYGDDMGIEETAQGSIDLFVHLEVLPTTRERLLQRRKEIAELYRKLIGSETVLLTLGMVETWVDEEHNCYLNKTPSMKLIADFPGRFSFCRFDVEDVVARMRRTIDLLNRIGQKKILLTVEPGTAGATFTEDNALAANVYSKSVLRVACELMIKDYANVDYWPMYDIISSFGTHGLADDNLHVQWPVIDTVTKHMIEAYRKAPGLMVEEQPLSALELYRKFFQVLYEEYDLDRARGVAERLLADHPNTWFGHDTMGHCHSSIGDFRAALGAANAALAMDPQQWALLGRVGALHEELGDLARAEEYFRAAAAQPGEGGERAQGVLDAFAERHKIAVG